MSTSSISYLHRRHIQLIRLLVGTVLTTKKLLLTVQEVGKYKMPKSSCWYQCTMKYYSLLNCMKWNQLLWCDSSTNLGRNQNWAKWRPLKNDSIWCMQWGFEMPMRNREWQADVVKQRRLTCIFEEKWGKDTLSCIVEDQKHSCLWMPFQNIKSITSCSCPCSYQQYSEFT